MRPACGAPRPLRSRPRRRAGVDLGKQHAPGTDPKPGRATDQRPRVHSWATLRNARDEKPRQRRDNAQRHRPLDMFAASNRIAFFPAPTPALRNGGAHRLPRAPDMRLRSNFAFEGEASETAFESSSYGDVSRHNVAVGGHNPTGGDTEMDEARVVDPYGLVSDIMSSPAQSLTPTSSSTTVSSWNISRDITAAPSSTRARGVASESSHEATSTLSTARPPRAPSARSCPPHQSGTSARRYDDDAPHAVVAHSPSIFPPPPACAPGRTSPKPRG